MDKLIIGISGRKQSGKGVLAKFLTANSQILFGVPSHQVAVAPMAEPIKRFCHDVLGLAFAQCWGTNEDKNTLTTYRWEDMPMYEAYVLDEAKKLHESLSLEDTLEKWRAKVPTGLMTARQVLQEIGTKMGRRFNENLWCEANMRRINGDAENHLFLVDDIRFPNEVRSVQNNAGAVIRLTRSKFAEDEHISEKGLDSFPANYYDLYVDNQNLGMAESCWLVAETLMGLGMAHSAAKHDLIFGDQ